MYGGLKGFKHEKWEDSVSRRVYGGGCKRLLQLNHSFRRMGMRRRKVLGGVWMEFVLCETIPVGKEAEFHVQMIPGRETNIKA